MMMKQSARQTLTTLLILSVVFAAMVSTVLIANEIIKGVTDTHPQANTAFDHFSTARHNYIVEWTQLIVLDAERAALTVSYNSNKSTMYKEALELASDAIPTSWDFGQNIKDSAKNAAKMAISYADEVSLQKALVSKTIEIQKKTAVVSQDKSRMETAYSHYVSHIYAFNDSDTTPSNNVDPAPKGKIPTGGGSSSTDLSVNCSNPECSTSYSASVYGLENIVTLSEGGSAGGYKGHLVTCTRDHAWWDGDPEWLGGQRVRRSPSDAPSGPYWSCPPNYPGCPKSANHVKKCPGTCGEYNVYPARGGGNYVNYHAMHRVACNENVPPDIWNYWSGDCTGFYWSCAGTSSCNNVSNHISGGSTPPTGSTPPPPSPPTDNTPNCSDCTSDCSSPCICSNSGTCGGTVSSPPSGSNPPSGGGSNPPSPTLVNCPNCPGSYDPNDASDKSYHTDWVNCINWGCSTAFRKCNPSASGSCVGGGTHSAN